MLPMLLHVMLLLPMFSALKVSAGPNIPEGLDKLFDSDDSTCVTVEGTALLVPWILLELPQPVSISAVELNLSSDADHTAKSDGVKVFLATVKMRSIPAGQKAGIFRYIGAPAGAQARFINITHSSMTQLVVCGVALEKTHISTTNPNWITGGASMYAYRNQAAFYLSGATLQGVPTLTSPLRCFSIFGVDLNYKTLDGYLRSCGRG